MPLTIVERIGFFHFVENFGEPIPALRAAVEKERATHPRRDISHSLIVLPEAFNFGHTYDSGEPTLPAHKILGGLRRLAGLRGLAFVAGILKSRSNSAYWVDECGWKLMCHKVGDDRKGIYEPRIQDPDIRNPIPCGGTYVGALICIDATEDDSNCTPRRQVFLQRLTRRDGGIKIVCIPARFHQTIPKPLSLLPGVRNCWYVVANGQQSQGGLGSFIADSDDNVIREEVGDSNKVSIWRPPIGPRVQARLRRY
jgi:predicted amidohydrolase